VSGSSPVVKIRRCQGPLKLLEKALGSKEAETL